MRIFLWAALLFILIPPYKLSIAQIPQSQWADKVGDVRDRAVKDIGILEDRFYLATRGELYVASDTENRLNSLFSLPHGSNEINCIAASGRRDIYVGTKRGLFKSEDSGRTWRNIFRTITPEKNNILAISISASSPGQILMGTQKGVFSSPDSGKSWNDISGVLRNRMVKTVAINHTGFYAGGDSGLFFTSDSGGHWQRLIVKSGAKDDSGETEYSESMPEEEATNRGVRFISTSSTYIYVALDKAVYYSNLGEKDWRLLPAGGLSGYINFILPSGNTSGKQGKIFVATTKGVFEYIEGNQRWEVLGSGPARANVNKIGFESDRQDILWAATDKGLFKIETADLINERRVEVEKELENIFVMMNDEPTFRELQQAAIRYAEVGPEKIKKWRDESRYRALLPHVSVGTSRNHSTNTEIYTSATRDYAVVGPEDESNNLNLSVTWELGDLIWSDDQTNIDVRSRLMVQLRNDILDDLRRAYYERKKLQFELAMNPPKDVKTRFEKELRLQELTSNIDDLTGNYLSSHMKK